MKTKSSKGNLIIMDPKCELATIVSKCLDPTRIHIIDPFNELKHHPGITPKEVIPQQNTMKRSNKNRRLQQ